MLVSIDYHPSPPQRRFHETQSDEIMYGGELGGGKTKALAMDMLLTACRYPNSTLYCFRATYQQGTDTMLEEMERSYPKEICVYRKDETTWHFVNSAKIKMRQCKSLDDAKKNDGKEFNKLYIDEAQHLSFDVFDYLCLRPRANKKIGIQPQVKFTAMQNGKGFAWIKRTFVDPLKDNVPRAYLVKDDVTGEESEIYRQFIPASLEDNKHIDDKYLGRLNMRSKRLQEIARGNRWTNIEGAAFKEWKDKPLDDKGNQTDKWTHVVKAFPIPDHWPIFRGYDYGRSSPYSFLWFTRGDETYGNRLFLIAELYGGTEDEEGLDESISKQVEKALKIERPLMEKHEWIDGVADPSIFSKSAFAEESIASVMAECGMIFRDPRFDPEVAQNVINNRLQGKNLIHEALLFDAEGHPGFQVFDTCPWFRKHFPELVRDPNNPEDVDSDKTNDHDYDAFRYVVVLTKPKVKAPVDIKKYRRVSPLGFTKNRDDDDNGKVISLPEIVIGG